ncbi:MAG: DUF2188 domain-containing protein [Bacteroidia bacterium]|nr:DUF2188 domain-containing protein [Bacteroidia bacterium]
MSDLRTEKFWISLLKKIAKIFAKKLGVRIRPATHNQHVVPYEDEWAVRGEGNKRVTAVYKYQDDAIAKARRIAINYGSDVIIHRQDGTIRDRNSY